MTLECITTRLAEATDFVEVAISVCALSRELYGIYSCIVSIRDADGRPLHAVDNAPDITDEQRRAYFDETWRTDPLLPFLRVVGNQAMEAPENTTVQRGVGYVNPVVHTFILPLLCPKGLLGAIKFRHDKPTSEPLRADLTTLGMAAAVRLTELYITPRPHPIFAQLTPRQLDVARSAANGRTNAEIAGLLRLSENTVKKHLKDAFEQLRVTNRTELAKVIRQAGPLHDHPVGITHRGDVTITRASA